MAIVARHLRFMGRLTQRMDRLGYDPRDPLYQAALRARDALQELQTTAQYASCTSGVGRASAPAEGAAGGRR